MVSERAFRNVPNGQSDLYDTDINKEFLHPNIRYFGMILIKTFCQNVPIIP